MRVEAYSAYVSAVRVLNGQLWKLFDELTAPEGSPAVWKDCLFEMHQCWVGLSATASRVSMIGPTAVATEAELLHHAMREWHVLCSEWARTAIRVGCPPQEDQETRFREAADAKRIRIASFRKPLVRRYAPTPDVTNGALGATRRVLAHGHQDSRIS
ncbi:hypothetical protein OHT57_01165 [Streptomyces sp. NBC_00285]|uniref:hypothetical protein n=1 Tax=Streptomyces sp. NBC_00285 TaxID=2975700 RepID=UPI002E29AFE1|nr:hypothetical protein [Streptomyces sp. NBC_00285]